MKSNDRFGLMQSRERAAVVFILLSTRIAIPHDGDMGSTFKQLWVSSNMHLPYVLYFIPFYKDLLRDSKKGAAIPHLNKELFYNLPIGIPPYKEKKRIARRINVLFQLLK